MRAPMHPNYRISFARDRFARNGFVAMRRSPIQPNRRGVPVRALGDAGESDVLMR